MLIKQLGSKPERLRVTFQFPSNVWADRVNLVGEFNGWNVNNLPLTRSNSDPNWEITLELQGGRAYQFRYLIDGTTWSNDCNADDYVPNDFGGYNSVVKL